LEGTLNIIWFQPPCHEQGHLPLDQVAQSSIQPDLEHCQGGGSHSFSGQPVPSKLENFDLICASFNNSQSRTLQKETGI